MTDVLETLIDISASAAPIIREVYDTQFKVEYKAPRDPVTAADRRANTLIVRRLKEAFPGVPIVAEESDPESFAGYRNAERVFFVDPLDGTKEFIDRNGEFVVMIGMVEGDVATAGVVHAPAQRRIWAGQRGGPCFECEEGGPRQHIRVSTTGEAAEARVVASRSHRSPALTRVVELLGSTHVLPVGSAGLKGARIATGAAEAYIGPGRAGKRWDACAVDAIVTAAGGTFSDAFGRPYDYRSESLENLDGIVATNGALHGAVLKALESQRVET